MKTDRARGRQTAPTLGELLVLLHNADEGRTLRAEVRDWWAAERAQVVVAGIRSPDGIRLDWLPDGGGELSLRRRIWFEAPARLRVEVWQGAKILQLGIRDDRSWRTWSEGQGEQGSEDGLIAEVPPLLDPPLLRPMRLCATLRLEPIAIGSRLERKVIVADAEPRFAPASGSDTRYRFEFDARMGTVMYSSLSRDWRAIQTAEVTTVEYNIDIPRERFRARD